MTKASMTLPSSFVVEIFGGSWLKLVGEGNLRQAGHQLAVIAAWQSALTADSC
jgi:hypothetical protein